MRWDILHVDSSVIERGEGAVAAAARQGGHCRPLGLGPVLPGCVDHQRHFRTAIWLKRTDVGVAHECGVLVVLVPLLRLCRFHVFVDDGCERVHHGARLVMICQSHHVLRRVVRRDCLLMAHDRRYHAFSSNLCASGTRRILCSHAFHLYRVLSRVKRRTKILLLTLRRRHATHAVFANVPTRLPDGLGVPVIFGGTSP